MRALVREAGQVKLVERPAPIVRRPDDVIVRVSTAGICRTDLLVADGRIASAEPITLGHELCGRVVACGEAAGLAPGVLVAIDPRVGDDFLGVTAPGGFADRVCVPAANALVLPGGLDPRLGAYVEPLAAALAVPDALTPGMRVGLRADNRFAALVAVVLQHAGFEVVRSGRCDAAVETTGTAAELAALCEALAPSGTLIVKSRSPEPGALPLGPIVDKQLHVRGVRYGAFARAVELVGTLGLDALLGESWPLARWDAAFARARGSEATKLFLTMDDEPCVA